MVPQLALTSYWTKYNNTLPKLCVMILDHMIQEHNLGVTFHRSNVAQPKILCNYINIKLNMPGCSVHCMQHNFYYATLRVWVPLIKRWCHKKLPNLELHAISWLLRFPGFHGDPGFSKPKFCSNSYYTDEKIKNLCRELLS